MIVHTLLESSHLAGNLLGDPSERDLFVYLPRATKNQIAGIRRPICCTRTARPPNRW